MAEMVNCPHPALTLWEREEGYLSEIKKNAMR
jgi:hypothetical protein